MGSQNARSPPNESFVPPHEGITIHDVGVVPLLVGAVRCLCIVRRRQVRRR